MANARQDDLPTPPGRRPRKPAPSRQPLTQDLIVQTAIAVLDTEGLEAVTMRRVAQELGTGPASLYAHVSGKQELRELMLDHIAAEVRLPEPDPARWREQLKEVALEVRRVYTSHRDIAKVSMGLIPTGPHLLDIADMQLGLMRAGGVPPRIAALAVDTLGMYIDADAIEDTFYTATVTGDGDPLEHFHKYIAEITEYFRALPTDRYPNIVAMLDDLTAGGGAERFEFGLDVLLRGIASYIEDSAPE